MTDIFANFLARKIHNKYCVTLGSICALVFIATEQINAKTRNFMFQLRSSLGLRLSLRKLFGYEYTNPVTLKFHMRTTCINIL